jgi:hypothetical protein
VDTCHSVLSAHTEMLTNYTVICAQCQPAALSLKQAVDSTDIITMMLSILYLFAVHTGPSEELGSMVWHADTRCVDQLPAAQEV